MTREDSRETTESAGAEVRIAVLLAVCAVLAAGIGLRSSMVSGDAGGNATAAIRGAARRGAEIDNVAARIYSEDAPLALPVAEADLRASAAKRAATDQSGIAKELLSVEGAGQAALAQLIARSAAIVADGNPGSATSLDGADLMKRVAALRAAYPDLVQLDPEAEASAASDLRRKSSLLLAALIPISVGFLCGALAEGFPHLSRRFFALGSIAAVAGLVMAIIVEVSI